MFGGNRQQRVLAPAASANTRRHAPEREFHRRQVPSEEAEAMKSLAADQSKSEGKDGGRERERGREGGREGREREYVHKYITSTKTTAHSHDGPLTGLVCPLRVQLREGGSETKLNTDRVPSREALARRVLSSLANDIARTEAI